MKIARSAWDIIAACGQNDDIEIIDEQSNYLLVEEKVQGIIFPHNYEVEISTAREGTGSVGFTPEQLACMTLQNHQLVETINYESEDARQAVKGLVAMATNDPADLIPSYFINSNLGDDCIGGRKELLSCILDRSIFSSKKDAPIIDALLKAFPKGLVIFAKSSTGKTAYQSIDFNTVRSLSLFVGGVAGGIAEDIISLMRFIFQEHRKVNDTQYYSKVIQVKESINGWLDNVGGSQGVFKKMARSAKLCASVKVRTTYNPLLNEDADGIPKIMMNPLCHSIRTLATDAKGEIFSRYRKLVHIDDMEDSYSILNKFYAKDSNPDVLLKNKPEFDENDPYTAVYEVFDPYLLNGETVVMGRTPMPMMTGCKIVLSYEVEIAHASTLPHIFSIGNEGDSDGDGMWILNFSARFPNASREEIVKMIQAINSSVMGPRGYEFVYGKEPSSWPYAAFVSYDDKWGKKALLCKGRRYTTDLETSKYLGMCVQVANHYKFNVGISYGVCSVLSFKTALMHYKVLGGFNSNALVHLQHACAIIWRAIYEGLGLSGYSPEAHLWFQLLNIGSWNTQFAWTDNIKGNEPVGPRKAKNDWKLHNTVQELTRLGELKECKYPFMQHPNSEVQKAMSLIAAGRKQCSVYGELANARGWKNNIDAETAKLAAIYGALRWMGQGRIDEGSVNRMIEDEQNQREGLAMECDPEALYQENLFDIVEMNKLYNSLSIPWLATLLKDACEVSKRMNAWTVNRHLDKEEAANNQ